MNRKFAKYVCECGNKLHSKKQICDKCAEKPEPKPEPKKRSKKSE